MNALWLSDTADRLRETVAEMIEQGIDPEIVAMVSQAADNCEDAIGFEAAA